jgi:hypothetical protein
MTLKLTKDQLRKLNERAGQLNTDSGQVFVQVVGRCHNEDGLWHVEVEERPAQTGDESLDSFSMARVLGTDTGFKSPVIDQDRE